MDTLWQYLCKEMEEQVISNNEVVEEEKRRGFPGRSDEPPWIIKKTEYGANTKQGCLSGIKQTGAPCWVSMFIAGTHGKEEESAVMPWREVQDLRTMKTWLHTLKKMSILRLKAVASTVPASNKTHTIT